MRRGVSVFAADALLTRGFLSGAGLFGHGAREISRNSTPNHTAAVRKPRRNTGAPTVQSQNQQRRPRGSGLRGFEFGDFPLEELQMKRDPCLQLLRDFTRHTAREGAIDIEPFERVILRARRRPVRHALREQAVERFVAVGPRLKDGNEAAEQGEIVGGCRDVRLGALTLQKRADGAVLPELPFAGWVSAELDEALGFAFFDDATERVEPANQRPPAVHAAVLAVEQRAAAVFALTQHGSAFARVARDDFGRGQGERRGDCARLRTD